MAGTGSGPESETEVAQRERRPVRGAAACHAKPGLPSVHLHLPGQAGWVTCLGTPPAAGRAWVHRVVVSGRWSVSSFYDGSAAL